MSPEMVGAIRAEWVAAHGDGRAIAAEILQGGFAFLIHYVEIVKTIRDAALKLIPTESGMVLTVQHSEVLRGIGPHRRAFGAILDFAEVSRLWLTAKGLVELRAELDAAHVDIRKAMAASNIELANDPDVVSIRRSAHRQIDDLVAQIESALGSTEETT